MLKERSLTCMKDRRTPRSDSTPLLRQPGVNDLATIRDSSTVDETTLYTIGFTAQSVEQFVSKLQDKDVRRVVDIRLKPNRQFDGFAKRDSQVCPQPCRHRVPVRSRVRSVERTLRRTKESGAELGGI